MHVFLYLHNKYTQYTHTHIIKTPFVSFWMGLIAVKHCPALIIFQQKRSSFGITTSIFCLEILPLCVCCIYYTYIFCMSQVLSHVIALYTILIISNCFTLINHKITMLMQIHQICKGFSFSCIVDLQQYDYSAQIVTLSVKSRLKSQNIIITSIKVWFLPLVSL